MSASARLNKLTRSPLVTGNTNQKLPPRTSQNIQGGQRIPRNTQQNTQQIPQQKGSVNNMQILTWHEQRLNKMDETLKNLDTSIDNNQLISQLIDTIGILDKKIGTMSNSFEILKKQNLKNENEIKELTKKQMENEVKSEVNKVKDESLKEDVVLSVNE